ncbi:MAG: endonuclease/exonuclease/phosphatase family protein [Caldilineaceae bacterium]
MVYLNTHLNDVSEEAKAGSALRNLAQLSELDPAGNPPVIMAGDFNCNPWSPVSHPPGRGLRRFLPEPLLPWRLGRIFHLHGFQGRSYFGLEWGGAVFWRVD